MSAKIELPDDLVRELSARGAHPEEILRKALEALPPPPTGWSRMGVHLPNGTDLRAWHNGRAWWATISNGRIVFKDEEFDAPSAAALRIAGRPMNGWEFWEAHIPGVAGWATLASLRPKQAGQGRGLKVPVRASSGRVSVRKTLGNDRKVSPLDGRPH